MSQSGYSGVPVLGYSSTRVLEYSSTSSTSTLDRICPLPLTKPYKCDLLLSGEYVYKSYGFTIRVPAVPVLVEYRYRCTSTMYVLTHVLIPGSALLVLLVLALYSSSYSSSTYSSLLMVLVLAIVLYWYLYLVLASIAAVQVEYYSSSTLEYYYSSSAVQWPSQVL